VMCCVLCHHWSFLSRPIGAHGILLLKYRLGYHHFDFLQVGDILQFGGKLKIVLIESGAKMRCPLSLLGSMLAVASKF
jgi:predicted TIM-barrel fold metal-dependent hydrolase